MQILPRRRQSGAGKCESVPAWDWMGIRLITLQQSSEAGASRMVGEYDLLSCLDIILPTGWRNFPQAAPVLRRNDTSVIVLDKRASQFSDRISILNLGAMINVTKPLITPELQPLSARCCIRKAYAQPTTSVWEDVEL